MLNSSDVLTAGSPKSTKFGASVLMALLVKYTPQREYRSALVLWDSLRPITLLKMDVESLSLANFPSMEASNFWVFLLTLGDMYCRLLRTSKLPLCRLVGGTPIPSIRTGELALRGLTATSQSPGVEPSLPVRLTRLGVRESACCCESRP